MPIRCLRSASPLVGSYPSTDVVPLVGVRYPSSTSVVVVLPAPLGPSSAKTSPWSTCRSMPATASTSPNDLRGPRDLDHALRHASTLSDAEAGVQVDRVAEDLAADEPAEVVHEDGDDLLLPAVHVAADVR